ncbi:glycosyltransferase sugar-binding region containing DXD motif domain-containing protein [Trichoderma breve]|uniref:Glycosyltransferase sugar-binding region containing DXD motif domain-containing protein n=1 Tax=Trichoderma breve TaxID=2034170 RepID=A0A9W9E732_9HYPO|nr:glycosyltransferase sugar-binding region containing DXD motif domain-containing protein [Trichoderma breve]KAJ4857046.1 glycosyltransferase sugar-binding region containing DXD motif domain-containing protein [Trichoderma breve]
MLNPRRAFIAAAFLLTVFFLITRSHNSEQSPSSSTESRDAEAEALAAANAQQRLPPPPPQKPMIDMSGMSTYEKLAYQYEYDIESKFPAYIWQTWKYTPGEGEFQFREQEASWSIEHPGFIHEVITDSVADTLLQLLYGSIPEVLEAYHALPLPVLKADLFRYLILYARGGIYSDIDTYAIKSALEWIPPQIPKETVGLVIGIEADPDRPDWADWYSRRIQFCQWTIQSKPGHPVLRDIISRITNSTLAMKKEGKLSAFQGNRVVDLTGPAVWTDTIMDYFNDERYFDMENSKGKIDYRNFTGMETSVGQMGAKDYDDPMAFVKHDFEGTWKPESERHIGEVQQELGEGEEAPKEQ